MSFVDPRMNPPDWGANDQPYLRQSPYFGQEPRRRRRVPILRLLISAIVLIALVFVGYTVIAPIFRPTVILVRPHPTLVIKSDQYSEIDLPTIYIHAGTDNNKIILQPSISGLLQDSGYQQNSDGSLTILNGDPVRGKRKLDITVPANTDLKVDTNSANINLIGITGEITFSSNSGAIKLTNSHVTGISLLSDNSGAITMTQSTLDGQMTLTNNSGAITVAQSTLNGQVTLTNNSGAITLTNSHVTGTSSLSNNSEAITVTQSTLDGQATLNNNSGAIVFNSLLGLKGTYTFMNNQGSIDATLPKNASFHIDAQTINGSIVSDYPGIQVQNKEIHADVGSPPHAHLSFKSVNGIITLRMQKGA